MICKCPNCNAALEYNATLDKMQCRYCGGVYEVGMYEAGEPDMAAKPEVSEGHKEREEQEAIPHDAETMSCKIYSCTACGAELMVNDVEVSTFCAYCGQPTIVFSRVSGELRPKYIVPFRISKEEAMGKIRDRVENSRFVPDEIKNYSVENVRGIYIPYCLYHADYYDDQMWKNEPAEKGIYSTKIYKREAKYTFKNFPVAMSLRLDSILTDRLEPFDLKGKKPFTPEYLSGFYADKYDMTGEQINESADKKMKTLFDRAVKETLDDAGADLKYSNPQKEVHSADYALLPAWFLTFRYENKPYTFVVNGQTGKIVGALPLQKSKVMMSFLLTALMVCLACALLFVMLVDIVSGFVLTDSILLTGLSWIGIFSSILYIVSFVEYKSMKMVHRETTSGEFVKFAHERQDKS